MKYFWMALILSSCTLFQKTETSNELVSLTDEVLKKNEGVEIEIRPEPNPERVKRLKK